MKAIFPGVMLAAVIALAALAITDHYGGPVMLLALLIGMAFNFLAGDARFAAGIDFVARHVLRLGVGLLGLRISWEQVVALGWSPLLLVVAAVALTLIVGVVCARLLGLSRGFGVLTGGAVGVCGASAAMAIAAVMPRHAGLQRDTAFTVVGVTVLSTVAMLLYPLLVAFLGYSDARAGVFLGATIHDVAQVVGAGYIVSDPAGDLATYTKLMRVAMLLPLVMLVAVAVGRREGQGSVVATALPWFLLLFAGLVVVNSLDLVPAALHSGLVSVAQGCLVTAIAALGVKTSLGEMAKVGPRAALLIAVETVVLALLVITALLWLPLP